MLHKFPETPKKNRTIARIQYDGASPINIRKKGYNKKHFLIIQELPYILISFPASTIVESCPIGISNKRVPSSASLIKSASLMIGIRLAQEEKTRPWAKKSRKHAAGIFEWEDSVLYMIRIKLTIPAAKLRTLRNKIYSIFVILYSVLIISIKMIEAKQELTRL